MHPRAFLDGFWRNDLADEVFVAMSFADRYTSRWADVIQPAVEAKPFGTLALKAVRTDIRRSGDSILSEIVSGIAHAQLVLADISVTDTWVEGGERRFARNSNVMYEVGLALACRQPVEVILVRDDDDPLLFDLSHIPVVKLNPTNTAQSIELLRAALQDRLGERQLLRDLRVRAALESLTQFDVNLIRSNARLNKLAWPGASLPAAVVMSLPRLLELKVLRLSGIQASDQAAVYEWTVFGREVAKHIAP